MEIRAGAYFSFALLSTILSLVVTFRVMATFVFLILPSLGMTVELVWAVLLLLLAPIAGGVTYVVFIALPASRAKTRGRKINLHLAYALNFISAMSSAGITPTEIFKSLSKQDIYGEIKEEASWIYRDVSLMGKDIITAIRDNIERTPSEKFKEFLQGMIVTVTSGGSLKAYFMNKAKQYMWENRQNQKQTIESLGIMAESYVTAAVAGVLLIMIVISLMMIMFGDRGQISFLYIFLFIIPIINFLFAWITRAMSEVA